MRIGNRGFLNNHTYIMGILNVTPDSFSDGGQHNDIDSALFHTEKMIKEGADIIDVGGESTRPGYVMISDKEEIERTAPVIERIKREFDIPVSIDTYKSTVARAAFLAGADMINDIWGFKYDPDMARAAAEAGVGCCLMHNRKKAQYGDFLADVMSDLMESAAIAEAAGIGRSNIVLDPGVGFAKSYEQNLAVIKNLKKFSELGFEVLLGTSRKSVIGLTLDLPADERVEGTLVTTVMAVMSGCRFVRVHDIKENKRAIIMTERILNG
ncbi:MAG: dihydropteroate synthase [Clostridiales bacterium]|nr:dihydropteroate synthase [Clostridiales bacterium]